MPWKFSLYSFDVKRPDGEISATADRERDDPEWEIEMFPEYESQITAIDVAVLVHLYEYTFTKDDVTLSIMEDSCTPFVLYVLPISCSVIGFILIIAAACWWKRKKYGTDEIVTEENVPLVEKAADKII